MGYDGQAIDSPIGASSVVVGNDQDAHYFKRT